MAEKIGNIIAALVLMLIALLFIWGCVAILKQIGALIV